MRCYSRPFINKLISAKFKQEEDELKSTDYGIIGQRTSDRCSHGGTVTAKHVNLILNIFRRVVGIRGLYVMDGFTDIGSGLGTFNLVYSLNYPSKINIAVDIDQNRIKALQNRCSNHGISPSSLTTVTLDFVCDWDNERLNKLHGKRILYFLNNINFTTVNFAFLQFFRKHAAIGSYVICYVELFRHYSNPHNTRNEWATSIEMVWKSVINVSKDHFSWLATNKLMTVYIYKKIG